ERQLKTPAHRNRPSRTSLLRCEAGEPLQATCRKHCAISHRPVRKDVWRLLEEPNATPLPLHWCRSVDMQNSLTVFLELQMTLRQRAHSSGRPDHTRLHVVVWNIFITFNAWRRIEVSLVHLR